MTEGTDHCRRSSTCQTRKRVRRDFTDEFLDDEEFEDDVNDKVE
ncbi:MAG: hypothetical protein WCF23_12680 [Candidatus Nitrosopolaris sp.]